MDACLRKFNMINHELLKWSIVIGYSYNGTANNNWITLWGSHTNFKLWHASNVGDSRHLLANVLYFFWVKFLQNIKLKSSQVRGNYHIRTYFSSIQHITWPMYYRFVVDLSHNDLVYIDSRYLKLIYMSYWLIKITYGLHTNSRFFMLEEWEVRSYTMIPSPPNLNTRIVCWKGGFCYLYFFSNSKF